MIPNYTNMYHGMRVVTNKFLPDEWDEYFGAYLISRTGWFDRQHDILFIHPHWESKMNEFLSNINITPRAMSNERGNNGRRE